MKGLIGFFDILGYQSFLENNSATDSALEVLDTITGIPAKLKDSWKATWLSQKGKSESLIYGKEVADLLSYIVFSDTIVLTLSYPENADVEWERAALAYLDLYAGQLFVELFCKGLPARGVIHEGEFITKASCLAGKSIVEAYRLCHNMEFAGLVFSPTLSSKLVAFQHAVKPLFLYFDKFFISYLTELKDGEKSVVS